MSSIAASLAQALPKPKYSGEEEELPSRAVPRGPRIVSASELDETQVVVKRAGPPAYGRRAGWRPREAEDFGDGGAFPEILFAQYPLGMGRTEKTKNNALAVQVDGDGKIKYDAIARQGHTEGRVIHTSFKDLIPLRQRAEAGDINLERPSQEEVEATAERTRNALAKLVNGAVAAQKPKTLAAMGERKEATYVRYTPASQMGDTSQKADRVMKIVERQRDPMEPPKFKHKKIPRGPPSPPPPVMHSPPRKLTAADQEAWKIPPPISNWKNPKGFTVPLDKRLAAAGKGLEDVTINDKFAQFSEALFVADRHAREEVRQRALMQQRLAEKEKLQKEEQLRQQAQLAREERAKAMAPRRNGGGRRRSRSRSGSYSRSESDSRSGSDSGTDSEEDAVREREEARQERRRDEERKLRQSRMGAERRMQVLAREQNRDISEKVALGLAKPTASKEGMYDSRLFNQTSGFDSGINEDNPYDKPLFAAQDAISSIYRVRTQAGDEDDEDAAAGDAEMAKIQKTSRFGEALGRGTFKGAREVEAREGPVQFEKEVAAPSGADPFNVDKFLSEVEQSSAGKRGYGLQEEGGSRQSKRARVDEDED
ncbi:transcriptional regulator cwf13 [Grosmannia clavigera kw1407]|uniref:Pre-mRNA-processing protein 45 n=1 Tax=Grosmannia clavigera (strain kw1407 / UAMH 11150) TaxID=655863 RepID=F0XD15_GROCL|nr:transcriptional regulator cwf13 [Grosmannia clavigera kw1407]EFX04320.1 transcriptional regulator cwf13 [Grosmannia clavigera kw1407]